MKKTFEDYISCDKNVVTLKKRLPFRIWYYFRNGWGLYFAFIFAAVNTLTVTYYLAIEKIPDLQVIFPSFTIYILFMIAVGIPLLVLIGYAHFKRVPAYGTEMDISQESNPYNYKLPPGYWREALAPALLEIIRLNLKLMNKESLDDKELNYIKDIQKKLEILKDGGHVGKPKRMSM